WGGYGWHGGWGGYGWRGWGYPNWGVGFGWGWGSYWGGYPYAYGYPYYYYPSYPYYPYYGPNYGPDTYAPADPRRDNGGNQNSPNNSRGQDSIYPGGERSPGVSDKTPMTYVSRKTGGDTGSANYWLANYRHSTPPRQEVRNVVQALLAMPPDARRRQIESGRYRSFSPEEQEFLNQVAQGVRQAEEPQRRMDGKVPVQGQ